MRTSLVCRLLSFLVRELTYIFGFGFVLIDREYAVPATFVPREAFRRAPRFGRVDVARVVNIAYSITVDVE